MKKVMKVLIVWVLFSILSSSILYAECVKDIEKFFVGVGIDLKLIGDCTTDIFYPNGQHAYAGPKWSNEGDWFYPNGSFYKKQILKELTWEFVYFIAGKDNICPIPVE